MLFVFKISVVLSNYFSVTGVRLKTRPAGSTDDPNGLLRDFNSLKIIINHSFSKFQFRAPFAYFFCVKL